MIAVSAHDVLIRPCIQAGQLRKLIGGVLNAMAANERNIPPLMWDMPDDNNPQVLNGTASSTYHPDTAGTLEAWACWLRLEPYPRPWAGFTEYRGTVDGFNIIIWAITDQAAWKTYHNNGK